MRKIMMHWSVSKYESKPWTIGGSPGIDDKEILMIIDSYDKDTEPVISLKDFYGEKKDLTEKC